MSPPSQRWVGEDGSYLVCGPGEPLAMLEVACATCRKEGRERLLTRVAVSTKLDADINNLWVRAFRTKAGWMVPRWRGEGDAKRLTLICGVKAGRGGQSSGGCRNMPDLPRNRILDEIAAMDITPFSHKTRRIAYPS